MTKTKDELHKFTYKIRDRSTGLFSTGGVDPKWNKRGKAWTSVGALKNAIRLYEGSRYHPNIPAQWEIVRFVAVEQETIGAIEFMQPAPSKSRTKSLTQAT